MDSDFYGFVLEKSFSLVSQDILIVFTLRVYVWDGSIVWVWWAF